MHYIPKLNDYVSWRNVEGWVYYVDDDHLTIEIAVKPKADDLVPMHRNIIVWLLSIVLIGMNLFMFKAEGFPMHQT